MKRQIVASILGIAASVASVASSYGQGSVLFKNYGDTTAAAIRYAASNVPAGKENQYVGSTFNVQLLYTLGNGGTGSTPVGSLTQCFSTDAPDQASGAGFFNGGAVTIPDYTAGAISFTVRAFNGADYASSAISGSTSFTLAAISTGIALPGEFGAAMQGFTVAGIVPEPSTFALIGLGTGALLFFRRRK